MASYFKYNKEPLAKRIKHFLQALEHPLSPVTAIEARNPYGTTSIFMHHKVTDELLHVLKFGSSDRVAEGTGNQT